ncbi:MAG: ADP-glyceromanno-heptose 6-epimerase [Desulfonatronovibrionaceae bacterium]
MYIVTGGAGFIGSAFVWELNQRGIEDILIVDNLGLEEKWKNLTGLKFLDYEHRDQLPGLLERDCLPDLKGIIHMGACSRTTEKDAEFLMANNFHYSRVLARHCVQKGLRFIYASSAATYGDGSKGFNDRHSGLANLRPLNMYGYSKHLFDLWAARHDLLSRVTGLKFFNVYGPNEYHKRDMKSVVCKAYQQIKESGKLGLFCSYRREYPHGGQMRDFVYIKDCTRVMAWLLEHHEVCGIYNLGTGRPRTWNDLARAVFLAMGREPEIEYIDMPETLRPKYQYYTRAEMNKLEDTGCPLKFTTLEDGVRDYVCNYLQTENPYLDSENQEDIGDNGGMAASRSLAGDP